MSAGQDKILPIAQADCVPRGWSSVSSGSWGHSQTLQTWAPWAFPSGDQAVLEESYEMNPHTVPLERYGWKASPHATDKRPG